MDAGAQLSGCGRYRYALWRRWESAAPPVLFIMLNPSTADAEQDDRTIRRCIGFARAWGAGGIHVVNLYPWRATDPRELRVAGAAVTGEVRGGVAINDTAIAAGAAAAGRIIVAWGAKPGPVASAPGRALTLLRGECVEALALTREGHPRHPLYVPGDVVPIPYLPGRWGAVAR